MLLAGHVQSKRLYNNDLLSTMVYDDEDTKPEVEGQQYNSSGYEYEIDGSSAKKEILVKSHSGEEDAVIKLANIGDLAGKIDQLHKNEAEF